METEKSDMLEVLKKHADRFNTRTFQTAQWVQELEIKDFLKDICKCYGDILGTDIQHSTPNVVFESGFYLGRTCGYYQADTNTIAVNTAVCNDMGELFVTLGHEGIHFAQQCFLSMDRAQIADNAIPYYDKLKQEQEPVSVDIYGMSADCKFAYVRASHGSTDDRFKEMTDCFYALGPSERSAYSFGGVCYDVWVDVSKQEPSIDQFGVIDNSCEVFSEKYGLDASYQEIVGLVDKARDNIFTGIEPTDPVEAEITYDMASVLCHQYGDYKQSLKFLDSQFKENTIRLSLEREASQNLSSVSLADLVEKEGCVSLSSLSLGPMASSKGFNFGEKAMDWFDNAAWKAVEAVEKFFSR